MRAVVILTTAPDTKTAERLAGILLRGKMAACVSYGGPFVSSYPWKGRFEKQREVLLFIKSAKNHFSKVKKAILKAHPYDVPEILCLPVSEGSESYLGWMSKVMRS